MRLTISHPPALGTFKKVNSFN